MSRMQVISRHADAADARCPGHTKFKADSDAEHGTHKGTSLKSQEGPITCGILSHHAS